MTDEKVSEEEESLIRKIVSALKIENSIEISKANDINILQLPNQIKSWNTDVTVYIFSKSLSEVSTGKNFEAINNQTTNLSAIGLNYLLLGLHEIL